MSSEPKALARLFAKYGPFRGLDLALGEATHIGRGDDNDVVLADPAVSHHHASIEFDRDLGQFVLIDRKSSNGTTLDGLPVRGRSPLGEVAVIGIGGVGDLLFSGPASPVTQARTPGFAGADYATTDMPDRTTIEEGPEFLADVLARIGGKAPSPDSTAADLEAPVLPGALGGPRSEDTSSTSTSTGTSTTGAARGGWALLVRSEGKKSRYPLARGSQVVGRGARVEIRIDHPHLSRRHARIDVGDTVAVEDLGSSNHTFVQGRAISHRTELEAGDHLAFGDVRAQLVFERES